MALGDGTIWRRGLLVIRVWGLGLQRVMKHLFHRTPGRRDDSCPTRGENPAEEDLAMSGQRLSGPQ